MEKLFGSIGGGVFGDFDFWNVELIEKDNERYILHCEGGPQTLFAKHCSDGAIGYGEEDIVVDQKKVEYAKNVIASWDTIPADCRRVVLEELLYE